MANLTFKTFQDYKDYVEKLNQAVQKAGGVTLKDVKGDLLTHLEDHLVKDKKCDKELKAMINAKRDVQPL